MSKPSRSQRRDIRQKAVRTLERADSVPPERAVEVRARATAVLAATKPRPSLPVPPTPPSSRTSRPSRSSVDDDEPVSARAASEIEKATRAEATAAKRKRLVNRAPLLLLGLVAIAFLIVFAAQRGGKLSADEDRAKAEATSAAAAVKPREIPRLPDDNSPPTVVTIAPSNLEAPPPSASVAPSTSASAAFSAAASAAFAEAASAAPSAAPKATVAPKVTAEPAPVKKPVVAPATAAPVKKPVVKKPPVSNDPY